MIHYVLLRKVGNRDLAYDVISKNLEEAKLNSAIVSNNPKFRETFFSTHFIKNKAKTFKELSDYDPYFEQFEEMNSLEEFFAATEKTTA